MKKLSIGILILSFLFMGTVTGSFAAAKFEGSIGYVDLSRLFDEYGKTKEYDAVLEAAHNEYQKERDSRLEKLREAQGKLDLLKEDERAKLQADMEKQRNDLLEFDRQKQTDLRRQRDEKIREILLEIEKIVSDYAKKEKIDLILNDRVLIFGSEPLDMTEPILQKLNESVKK